MDGQMDSVKTVLVVDDDAAVRDVLRQSLENSGYSVTCCANGESALLISRERSYDAIIVDYRMPGINGAIVAATIRVLIPEAIVIGISGSDDSRNLLAAGAHVFLRKPVDFDHLMSILRGNRPV
jgi:CheY-like chemotaxis protein